MIIKKYIDFIKEDKKGFSNLGEWIDSLSDDEYVMDIVNRYLKEFDPDIELSNAINLLDDREKADIEAQKQMTKELEEQEKSIINRNINKDLINRQKEILTRLLESEKAMMERGFEDKRESKSGVNQIKSNLIEIKTYNRDKLKQVEMLRVVDPAFSIYYKSKAETYFNLVD